ncbi:hypothetical protein LXL04_019263 [Taraxacum kok-saghyz]
MKKKFEQEAAARLRLLKLDRIKEEDDDGGDVKSKSGDGGGWKSPGTRSSGGDDGLSSGGCTGGGGSSSGGWNGGVNGAAVGDRRLMDRSGKEKLARKNDLGKNSRIAKFIGRDDGIGRDEGEDEVGEITEARVLFPAGQIPDPGRVDPGCTVSCPSAGKIERVPTFGEAAEGRRRRRKGTLKGEYQVEKVIEDMRKLCNLNPQVISSTLVKGGSYDYAAKMFKLAISEGYDLDHESLLSILSSYSSSGRHPEALDLLDFLKEHAPESGRIITEALIVILCRSNQLDAAIDEYRKNRNSNTLSGSSSMYESLIEGCESAELFSEASQVLSDMMFTGIQPSKLIYEKVALMYCKMGFPAHDLVNRSEIDG